MITAVRRINDGLLADVQESPNWPTDIAPRLQNAVRKFGGAAAEWALIEIPSALWVDINQAARQFAVQTGETVTGITQSTPPVVTIDVTTIENTGADTATITANVNDAGYTGLVTWRVILPDGSRLTEVEHMAAGATTLELTTTLEGEHWVQVETELHGVGSVEVTGV